MSEALAFNVLYYKIQFSGNAFWIYGYADNFPHKKQFRYTGQTSPLNKDATMNLGQTLLSNDQAAVRAAFDPSLAARYDNATATGLQKAKAFFDAAAATIAKQIVGGATTQAAGVRVSSSHAIFKLYGMESGTSGFAPLSRFHAPWAEFCDWAQNNGLKAYWRSFSDADNGKRWYRLQVEPLA